MFSLYFVFWSFECKTCKVFFRCLVQIVYRTEQRNENLSLAQLPLWRFLEIHVVEENRLFLLQSKYNSFTQRIEVQTYIKFCPCFAFKNNTTLFIVLLYMCIRTICIRIMCINMRMISVYVMKNVCHDTTRVMDNGTESRMKAKQNR